MTFGMNVSSSVKHLRGETLAAAAAGEHQRNQTGKRRNVRHPVASSLASRHGRYMASPGRSGIHRAAWVAQPVEAGIAGSRSVDPTRRDPIECRTLRGQYTREGANE